jgi:hypothetical protein
MLGKNVAGILAVDKHMEFFKIKAKAAEEAQSASCYNYPDQMQINQESDSDMLLASNMLLLFLLMLFIGLMNNQDSILIACI